VFTSYILKHDEPHGQIHEPNTLIDLKSSHVAQHLTKKKMGSTEESYAHLKDKPQSNKDRDNNVLKGCKPII